MPDIKLGSLFDGIGVFPLAASRCGIRPVWASEIEKAPISITKRHFPDMAHLGDITKVDGGKIPPVHVITFGSPCQNLSLIGNRSGLAGAKSSLFYQAFRIIQEMRDATDNLYPAIAVWENVMGAFSTNDRMDFRAVLSAFSDTEVPMPPSGRWGNAGMVRGGTPDVCWRLMDAQYWAGSRRLARRQRIFVVADFGGRRAADILFKPRPMLPLPPPCGEGGRAAAEGDRTASFSIRTTKLTGKVLAAALGKVARAVQKHHRKALTPQGRQSVKKLMNHYGGKSAMPYVGAPKDFDRIAKEFHVDYAFHKVSPGHYLLFFKANQADAITAAFQKYSAKVLNKEQDKASILGQLRKFTEQIRTQAKEKQRTREAVKDGR